MSDLFVWKVKRKWEFLETSKKYQADGEGKKREREQHE